MNQAERRVWLIKTLLDERQGGHSIAVPAGASEQRDLLRALMNVRPPEALADEALDIQDVYLQQRLLERGGATDAVRHHLDHNDPNLKVIFNVFLASDEAIYRSLLQTDR